MTFKEKPINRLYAFALAGVFTIALAGCGGGGGTAQTPAEMPDPDPQAACEADGGRYMDGACVTAAELLAMERADIKMKIDAAQAAVGAVDDDSTDAEVSAADAAIAAAKAAIAAAAGVPAEEKAANTGTVTALETRFHNARTARMDAMDMAATETNRKLFEGIGNFRHASTVCHATGSSTICALSAPFGDPGDLELSWDRRVTILSEDKDAALADNHGWEGKRYTASPAGGGTYEVVVYSNPEEPTEGEKFSAQYSATFTGGTLDEATTEGTAGRVASPSFDHTAGLKRFKLPSPNPRGETKITVPGSYHGVPGTYSCTPGAGTCAASFAGPGFALGGVAADGTFAAANAVWTFKPTDANARVMSTEDTQYQSYGWWLHKSADGKTWTAVGFTTSKGTHQRIEADGGGPGTAAITAFRALHGTATYRGGAAGLYAFSSATGGANDAGHFTARATFEADFTANTLSGTVDRFTGADGESRNWSVELKKSGFESSQFGVQARTDTQQKTVWTVDGTPAAAAGAWFGIFYDNGDDGVPKAVTGEIRAEYAGTDTAVAGREVTLGRMWGAFGAKRQ